MPPLPDGDTTTRMSAVHETIAGFVVDTLATGQRPVSIAGDCCSAIGMLTGLQRAGIDPTLVWFDAHGDFNTMETTLSGFLGGMPLAMLVGRGDLALPEAVGLAPLPESRVILTDGRDLDPPEAARQPALCSFRRGCGGPGRITGPELPGRGRTDGRRSGHGL